MSDFLVMRSFDNQREPTVVKVRSDGIRMYCEARYVIVLDEEGNVVERINRPITYTGNYLVILSPIVYKGWKINLSVVLEIGFSRSVPYQQFEQRTCGGVRYRSVTRTPIAQLTDEKICSILSIIGDSFKMIVDEDTSHRKNLVWSKYGKDRKEMPIGMFVAIPLDARPLVYVCFEKDFISRINGHIQLFIDLVRSRLVKLKYAYCPKGEIKRFKVAKEIADILFAANYPAHFLEVIRSRLGKETRKVRSLFEQIVDEFAIKQKPKNDLDLLFEELGKIFSNRSEELIGKFKISVQTHPKRDERRLIHARGCLRLEIHPSEEAIQKKHGVAQVT
ncbi:hypothetical protein K9M47_02015 [Candidatus Gracilibacteria bacterium]|nr:hypothetical protein [Candidatus Gracilibacteria bacterium]MCF7898687.1 hypothetical protein [Candidatus Paceibacterota bacterium]